jgi:hypothetical protein
MAAHTYTTLTDCLITLFSHKKKLARTWLISLVTKQLIEFTGEQIMIDTVLTSNVIDITQGRHRLLRLYNMI